MNTYSNLSVEGTGGLFYEPALWLLNRGDRAEDTWWYFSQASAKSIQNLSKLNCSWAQRNLSVTSMDTEASFPDRCLLSSFCSFLCPSQHRSHTSVEHHAPQASCVSDTPISMCSMLSNVPENCSVLSKGLQTIYSHTRNVSATWCITTPSVLKRSTVCGRPFHKSILLLSSLPPSPPAPALEYPRELF